MCLYQCFAYLRNGSIAGKTPGGFLHGQGRWAVGNAHNSTPGKNWCMLHLVQSMANLRWLLVLNHFSFLNFHTRLQQNMENLFMSKSFSQICCGNNSLLKKHHEGVLSFQRMYSRKDERVFKLLIDQVPFVFGHTKNENKNEDNRDNIKYYGVL